MSHEVENMFSVNETPWHGLGEILDQPPTIDEAIVSAGLDWEVEMVPLATVDGMDVPNRAIRRSDTGRILGVVGPVYEPLQNRDAFNFFQPWIDKGAATLETAGSLRDGERVWVLAKIGDPFDVVKNDPVLPFALLSNDHSGKRSVRVGFTPIRVVCANTLGAAHRSRQSKLLGILHNGRTLENLGDLHEMIDIARGTFIDTAEQYRQLAGRQCNAEDLVRYVRAVFGKKPKHVELAAIPEHTGADLMVKRITPLFEAGRGADISGVRGTYWGAYNAVTEYLSHERGTSKTSRDMRLDSAWFGDSEVVAKKALKVALKMAA